MIWWGKGDKTNKAFDRYFGDDVQTSSKIYLKAGEGLNEKEEVDEVIEEEFVEDIGEELDEKLEEILNEVEEEGEQHYSSGLYL